MQSLTSFLGHGHDVQILSNVQIFFQFQTTSSSKQSSKRGSVQNVNTLAGSYQISNRIFSSSGPVSCVGVGRRLYSDSNQHLLIQVSDMDWALWVEVEMGQAQYRFNTSPQNGWQISINPSCHMPRYSPLLLVPLSSKLQPAVQN